MAETPHAKLRKEICAYLASIGAWYVSTNSQGYGRKGIPDVLCCYRGRFVAIEVKAGRDKPSPWQLRELGGITTSGGLSIVAYSLQEVTDLLRKENEVSLGQLTHAILTGPRTPITERAADGNYTRIPIPFETLYKK